MRLIKYITIYLVTICCGEALYANNARNDSDSLALLLKQDSLIVSENDKYVKQTKKKRYRTEQDQVVFVPKKQWLFGGTISYSNHNNNNFSFLILDDWEGKGYTVGGSLYFARAVSNDLAIGFKAGFNRSLLNIDYLKVAINDDLTFELKDNHSLSQSYYGVIFMRNFLSLFRSKRFGLFNDTAIAFESGRSKLITGEGGVNLDGTYEEKNKISIGIAPGLSVFINNNAAVELSVGLIGYEMTYISQITNQVEYGNRRTSAAKFGVDIFSLKLGATIYFNGRKAM